MYCVIDTERIKGNQIYLLSYQLYGDDYSLIESKTFNDISIDISNRKAPKKKSRELDNVSIKVNSFTELYEIIRPIVESNTNIIFSTTDVHTFKSNCKLNGITYNKLRCIDLQEVLYEESTSTKHKSNLKGYCEENKIKHNAHIPESDCEATFILFRNLIEKHGIESILSRVREM